MKKIILSLVFLGVVTLLSSFVNPILDEEYSLTITVDNLQNSDGVVQFTIYNKDGTIPDEHYENYYLQRTSEILNNSSVITFENLPQGTYAINILHDEDENGEIKKGWILPVEGIGFSNFESIGLMNRPNFSKASFELNCDLTRTITIVYM